MHRTANRSINATNADRAFTLATIFVAIIALTLVTPTFAATPLRAQAAAAAPHPNFTGTWVMDTTKSDHSPTTPSAMTYIITQSGDHLSLVRDVTANGSHSASPLNYGIDGNEWKNTFTQAGNDVAITSVLSWQDTSLVIKGTLHVADQEVHQVDRWTLAADGKSMRIDRTVDVGGQHFDSKIFMIRR